MVVIVVLVLFAGVEGKTTQEFLRQTFIGRSGTNQTRAEVGVQQDRSFVARLVVLDPSVQSIMDPTMAPMPQGPEPLVGLRDVDLKQLVAIDTTSLIDMTGMYQDDAVDAINAAGLKVQKITYDYSDKVPAGCVVRQEPQAGTFVRAQTGVELVIAQTKIAIQSFPIDRGIGGEVTSRGQLIVHRLFDVELMNSIQNIPIFAIANRGSRHTTVEARAQSIAENLLMAWGLLAEGGYLEAAPDTWVMTDDEAKWQLRGPFAPAYSAFPESYPAIYVRHDKLGSTPLRIMTVYPEDAAFMGQPVDETGRPTLFTQQELAEYLVSLFQAHYTMLGKRSGQLEDFENLEICKTREGKIFKEICIRALEEARDEGTGTTSVVDLKSALARVAVSQRYRLLNLAFNAPKDWRLKDSNE
jgi:hypothetical protein